MRSYTVAARTSPLSRAQVDEVERELRRAYGTYALQRLFVTSHGDLDRTRSLRDLPPSDFFTREVDWLVQEGLADFSVHSAKDLPPEPMEGMCVVGLTQGLDSRDAIVLRQGLDHLQPGAVIGTSSARRDQAVRQLQPEIIIKDLRGTIEKRLARLQIDCDGVVIAECALQRLGLGHLPRLFLPGPSARGQGQLALCALETRDDVRELLAPIVYEAWLPAAEVVL